MGRILSVSIDTTKKAKTPYSKVTKVYGFVEEAKAKDESKIDSEVNNVEGGQ